MSDLQIDDTVKATGYDIPGFITQMRVLDTGIVAKVCHQDGFKNWYNVTAQGSLIFRAVSANLDKASYRCPSGTSGA